MGDCRAADRKSTLDEAHLSTTGDIFQDILLKTHTNCISVKCKTENTAVVIFVWMGRLPSGNELKEVTDIRLYHVST